ncbi:hypothetical protein IX317_001540 [Fusobacterium sp. DD29]|uniref:hypothetical protein n=1 Tax=unclassified Fusobacterium TaxID=2648384 RepID=UPI001B8C53BD|nr:MULTISPECIES: hypothetical protein [unclassified Fusobacterium]MBR8702195.1 hypothetical protein [Fusobacterium sp. DD45]MBR8712018.1 hypothetical protein [Fusobacterium sp. DD28]MBR8749861.1 hypothetical protein [Fusobacterium sp. DD29]MBR8752588.1 hypothetical protein [Fusobacterium sp. DD26]MBR8762103.1 hypothetical protein [Fusobacterium sp. DD25]
MFYSVFFKVKGDGEIKKILNFKSKEEVLKNVYLPYKNDGEFLYCGEKILKDDIEFFQVVKTGFKTSENYENVKRYIKETGILGEKFLNEKFPSYYAKDITKEL